jgi:tRNA modification GTPase
MKRGRSLGETHDAIAAIITPPGEGGIAAIRIAGPGAVGSLQKFFLPYHPSQSETKPFVLRLGKFRSASGETLDEVMAVVMPSGHSYTGLDQVEIFCHGGRAVVQKILSEILKSNTRAAEPGEFTRLAFESGRIDLAKAEAVAEIISAQTEASYRASREHLLGHYSEHIDTLRERLIGVLVEVEAGIDFSDDAPEVRGGSDDNIATLDEIAKSVGLLIDSYKSGRIISEGFTIAIGGRPNAGKSSLFNLLLRHERALVTPTPGTTRDYLQERIDLGGYLVNLVDTAGIRQSGGKIERAGQKRAKEIISKSDLLIWMVDLSKRGWLGQARADTRSLDGSTIMLLGNKIDLLKRDISVAGIDERISCRTGAGVERLVQSIRTRIESRMPDLTSGLVVTSLRHKQKLTESRRHLVSARKKLALGTSGELVAFDLHKAIDSMAEITGKVYTEEVLGRIFSKFCIGK